MKNTQFHFFLVFLILGFGVLGYTSYRTIDFDFSTGVATAENAVSVTDTVSFENSNNDPIEPSAADPVTTVVTSVTSTTTVAPAETPVGEPVVATSTELTGDRKVLAAALSNLIKDDIRMKIGSSGTRVGTVQKFINLYENKQSKVDNKYGEGLKKSVQAFQTATDDEADGLADPGTYQKMIDWLKTN